jgi:sigma-E factor negative regulatory protein RseB
MSRSSHEVDYRGVVTFQRGDDMQVMQIAHSVTGGSTSEQMTRLTGQGAQPAPGAQTAAGRQWPA